MRLSTASLLAAAVAPIAVSAAPFRRGTDNGTLLVLQFAHVLEQLETQFYQQALAKFQPSDFTAAGFTSADIPAQQFTAIQSDEAAHVTALESIITSFGATPVTGCKFDFTSVLTDVKTMAPVARLVENVGVGAYLGAAHLVQDPARHQTVLNMFQGGSAIPQAFDIPLLPQEVLAIAGPFISGCDLGVPGACATVTIPTSNCKTDATPIFHSHLITCSSAAQPFSISLPLNQCVVPEGINGPVAIWVTKDDQPLNNNCARPREQRDQSIGQLIRNQAGTPPPSTTTVPPAQASAILPSTTPPPNNAAVANGISMVSLPPPMTTSA
ncbi:ferritin-like domain-containing protein [Lactarius deliciosus]|nr:ferritin-like domain-containing protein [Lactarius deliciosus]